MEKIKYEIKKVGITWALLMDSNDSTCPHQTIYMVATNQMGGVGFAKQSCCTQCPLAELHTAADGTQKYTIHCGGASRSIDVTEFKEAPKPQPGQNGGGTLITM